MIATTAAVSLFLQNRRIDCCGCIFLFIVALVETPRYRLLILYFRVDYVAVLALLPELPWYFVFFFLFWLALMSPL